MANQAVMEHTMVAKETGTTLMRKVGTALGEAAGTVAACFRHGTVQCLDPKVRAKMTPKEKAEVDAAFYGLRWF